MTGSVQSSVKGSSSENRIQFKKLSSKRLNSGDNSRSTVFSRNTRKSGSLIGESDISISKILDPTYCYHPECSFAYNITKDQITKPSFITECLPTPTYQRLAKLWNMDPQKTPLSFANRCKKKNLEEEDEKVEEFIKSVEKELGIRSDISDDLQVNAYSQARDEKPVKSKEEMKANPYAKFLKEFSDSKIKQTGNSRLGKKAGRITKKIIDNFLAWYQSLGENDDETFIEDSTLQELFQIGFDMPAAKALAVRVKELATVPECLAVLRKEPKHATSYALKQFLKEDIKLESIPLKMYAFGKMLPLERPPLRERLCAKIKGYNFYTKFYLNFFGLKKILPPFPYSVIDSESKRFVPPKNNVQKTWMECSRVPKDLDTMKTIWEGLEQLRSTIAFSNWLKINSEIKPPAYLEEKGLLKINYEEWNQMYKGFEVDVGNLEMVASDMKIIPEKFSIQELKSLESSSAKYESLSIY